MLRCRVRQRLLSIALPVASASSAIVGTHTVPTLPTHYCTAAATATAAAANATATAQAPRYAALHAHSSSWSVTVVTECYSSHHYTYYLLLHCRSAQCHLCVPLLIVSASSAVSKLHCACIAATTATATVMLCAQSRHSAAQHTTTDSECQ
jgi:hypothetical protein